MPQIFHPSANTISKASILGGLFFLAGILTLMGLFFFRSSAWTKVGIPIEQPVPFSHKHHVSEIGIDCRYCHTSVEDSSFAGIPPMHTCMTCHSQIFATSPVLAPVRNSYQNKVALQWNRVNDLPDYVYFDHEIHIAKGVGCETCHGRVDQMPLTEKAHTLYMIWCLDCHRHPEKYLRPSSEILTMGYQPQNQIAMGQQLFIQNNIRTPEELTNCTICHR